MSARVKRDCAHPRARHEHGTRQAYLSDQCRCYPCSVASSRALAAYRRGGCWREQQLVHRAGTVRRLQALMTLGYTAAELAPQVGVTPYYLANLRTDRIHRRLSAGTAAAVARVYDTLWDKPSTGLQANRQRAKARTLGYHQPLAWDDDEIDDPTAQPCTPGNGARELQPCGTEAAYKRHQRRGEQPCRACLAGNSRAVAERRGRAA